MKNKKGFTLSETLIVIILIATMAAVAIPQYKKLLEARKSMEAEVVLSVVRSEQERRCAIGKAYAPVANLTHLLPVSNTSFFTYTDGTDGESLVATRKDTYSYALKMSSYRDGRICCTGTDCSKFSYPLCSSFTPTSAAGCKTADTDPGVAS